MLPQLSVTAMNQYIQRHILYTPRDHEKHYVHQHPFLVILYHINTPPPSSSSPVSSPSPPTPHPNNTPKLYLAPLFASFPLCQPQKLPSSTPFPILIKLKQPPPPPYSLWLFGLRCSTLCRSPSMPSSGYNPPLLGIRYSSPHVM